MLISLIYYNQSLLEYIDNIEHAMLGFFPCQPPVYIIGNTSCTTADGSKEGLVIRLLQLDLGFQFPP